MHAKTRLGRMPIQREQMLLRALHSGLLARGVRLCASNVGFLCNGANPAVLVCNFIGVSTNCIALVLARKKAGASQDLRKYLESIQELLEPLLTTKTRFVFFVFCLCTWHRQSRLQLRRVCVCAS